MKYEIYRDNAGQFRWRLVGRNGEKIASGESYLSKADCHHAIAILKGSQSAAVVDLTVQGS